MDNSSGQNTLSLGKKIPGFAKILILLQTAIIFFLSFWIYEEYLNNPFLQVYVNSLLQGSAFTIIGTAVTSIFLVLAVTLYLRLHRTTKELHEILLAEAPELTGSASQGFMDRRTEEHLVEMIRKRSQAENAGNSASMPVLKRVDQDQNEH